MAKTKGRVTGCGKGKYSYFITLEGHDGFYFNTKYEPKCGEGDIVGIEFEQKAENRGNVKRVTVLERNSTGYADTSSNSSGGTATSFNAASGGDRQESIVWQSSRKDALVAVGILLHQEAFALKGKPDAKRVQIEELLDEITFKYFSDATDPKASNAYKTNAEVEADEAAAEPPREGASEDESDAWGDSWDD